MENYGEWFYNAEGMAYRIKPHCKETTMSLNDVRQIVFPQLIQNKFILYTPNITNLNLKVFITIKTKFRPK